MRVLLLLAVVSAAYAAKGKAEKKESADGPAASAPAAFASEEAVGICEKAFYRCFTAPGNNLPWDALQCLSGYSFCEKYIKPLL